jgi:circadian clock protein KaiB
MDGCNLKLYVRGSGGRFLAAIHKLRALCDELLDNGYRLEVVDLKDVPHLAQQLNIFMVPTLVWESPPGPRRFVGSLDNTERLRQFLLQVRG